MSLKRSLKRLAGQKSASALASELSRDGHYRWRRVGGIVAYATGTPRDARTVLDLVAGLKPAGRATLAH